MRTFKIYSLSNFQIYNTVLLTIDTMLSLTSPGVVYFTAGSFVPFDPHLPFCPPPKPTSSNLQSVLSMSSVFFFNSVFQFAAITQ